MFSEIWHTRVGVLKICIFNRACYTSIFTIFKGPYVSHILYSSLNLVHLRMLNISWKWPSVSVEECFQMLFHFYLFFEFVWFFKISFFQGSFMQSLGKIALDFFFFATFEKCIDLYLIKLETPLCFVQRLDEIGWLVPQKKF